MESKPQQLVVVIDDDLAVRKHVELLLKNEPYQTITFSSANEAKREMNSLLPDAVLLDIMMPEVSGIEFCSWFREQTNSKKVPVLFLSALDPSDQIVEAFSVGGTDYMLKPLKGVELRARLKLMLDNRRQSLALERQLEIRKHLANIALHDIRDPIWAIREYTDRIRSKLEDSKELEWVGGIEVSCDQISNLCDSVLSLAMAEEGRLTIVRSRMDLSTSLNRLVKSKAFALSEKSCTVVLPDSNASSEVYVDESLFERVLENLLQNAIRYSEERGVIECQWHFEGNRFVLMIRNEGPQLAEGDHERIFEPFQKGGLGESGGYGVGLAFCRFCVEAHGGTIEAGNWSEKEAGEGARGGVAISVAIPFEVPESPFEEATHPSQDAKRLG